LKSEGLQQIGRNILVVLILEDPFPKLG